MQDINLNNMLLQLTGKVSQAAVSDATAVSSRLPLTPVIISVNGAATTLTTTSGRTLATVATQLLGDAPIDSVVRSADGKALWAFSKPQNLFSTIVSAQQQQSLIAALARQPMVLQTLTDATAPIQLTQASVKTITGQQITLNLQPPLPQLREVTVTNPQAARTLQPGQTVQVQVQQIGKQWTATLIAPALQKSAPQSQPAAPISPVKAQQPAGFAPIKIALPTEHPLVVKTLQQVFPQSSGATVTASLLPTVKQLIPPTIADVLDKSLKSGVISTNVTVDKQQRLTLNTVIPLVKASITESGSANLTTPALTTLNRVSVSVEASLAALIKQSKPQQQVVWQALTSARQPQATDSKAQVVQSKVPLPKESLQGNSPEPKTSAPLSAAREASASLSEAAKQQLQQAIKHHFVQAEPATKVATNINQAVAALRESSEPELRALGDKLNQAIRPAVATEPSVTAIQQSLQVPDVPITPQLISKPKPANSMLNGLITLLQISLATRLPATNTLSTSDKVHQVLTSLTQVNQSATKDVPSRTAMRAKTQEVTSIEQRHSLLRSLTQMLSGHQFSKMTQADTAAQGQETLFYALPGIAGPLGKDIELLIQREAPDKENKQTANSERSQWRLTMLLDIGEKGEVLCKCELQDNALGLDLYTSNESLKDTVLEFLPKLKQRMTAFGLEIVHSHCQLGAIPSSLRPKPYQLLHTQA